MPHNDQLRYIVTDCTAVRSRLLNECSVVDRLSSRSIQQMDSFIWFRLSDKQIHRSLLVRLCILRAVICSQSVGFSIYSIAVSCFTSILRYDLFITFHWRYFVGQQWLVVWRECL